MKKLNIYNIIIILCMILVCLYTFTFQFISHDKRVFSNIITIIILILPYVIEKFTKLRFNNVLKVTYTIFTILASYLGTCLKWYNTISYYDNIVHTLFGVVGSVVALNLLFMFKKYDKKNIIFNILFVISITMFMAVTWEFVEYFYDIFTNHDTQHVLDSGVVDTMTDLLVAFIGGLTCIFFYYLENVLNKKWLIKKYIKVLGDEYGR